MAQTYSEWRRDPEALSEVDVGGFYINFVGASLHDLNGRMVLTSVVDESTGHSLVIELDTEQEARIAELLPPSKETFRAIQDWHRGLDLEDNWVLGTTTNRAWRVLVAVRRTSTSRGGRSCNTRWV